LSIPAVIGSLLEAELAIDLPDDLFNNTIAIIMIGVIMLIILKPHRYISIENKELSFIQKILLTISFLIVGFYSGWSGFFNYCVFNYSN